MEDVKAWYENLPAQEKEEMMRQAEMKWTRMENHPLYRKVEEIVDIVESIIDSLPEDERDFHEPVREAAMTLSPKFAGVYESDMWLLVMQSAAVMRYNAQCVATGAYGFEVLGEGNVDKSCVEQLRHEMNIYKQLFVAWMNEVHAMPHHARMDEDEWNVFRRA